MKYRLFITLICVCMVCTSGIGSVGSDAIEDNEPILMYNNVSQVDVDTGGPSDLEYQKYNYTTSSKNEIAYILNYLNSFNLEDDGEMLYANDVSSYLVKIHMIDGSIINCGFYCGRFYYNDNTDKQYAIDSKEYNRFLDFIYALKTEKIVLPDEVTFELSEWAKEGVEKAIERGLVPELNQINYKGKINRLEVCQFIANYLKNSGFVDSGVGENPFLDTNDESVVALYHFEILSGKSKNLFCPYDLITREEFAKILAYTYHFTKSETMLGSSEILYKDQYKISDWAMDSVRGMTSLGLFKGNENGEFEPQKNITKEEVILILLRLSELIE